MAGLGTLITTLGWLLLLFAFAGPVAFEFEGIGPIPGLVLLFGGRMLRVAARRRRNDQEESLADLSTPAPQPARAPAPTPAPVRRQEPPRPVSTPGPAEQPADDDGDSYAEALRAAADDVLEGMEGSAGGDETSIGLSSQEMIAKARRRWDRRT